MELDNLAAHHEAGHVIAAWALDQPIDSVAVAGRGHGGGEFRQHAAPAKPREEAKVLEAVVTGLRPSPSARAAFRPSLVVLAAGCAAQHRLGARQHDYLCADDLQKIKAVVTAITGSESEMRALLAEIEAEAERLVDQHWQKIVSVAGSLRAATGLDRASIELAIECAGLGPAAARRRHWEEIIKSAENFHAQFGPIRALET